MKFKTFCIALSVFFLLMLVSLIALKRLEQKEPTQTPVESELEVDSIQKPLPVRHPVHTTEIGSVLAQSPKFKIRSTSSCEKEMSEITVLYNELGITLIPDDFQCLGDSVILVNLDTYETARAITLLQYD